MPTRDQNRRHWDEEYDWKDLGEEWTVPGVWKAFIIENGIEKYTCPGQCILEIGPGGGRWTQELLAREPRRLIAVDLAARCLELCRQRFGERPELELHLNDGRDLTFVPTDTIDFVWTFDVFVHLEAEDIEGYFREFRRVMRSGAHGVVHYPSLDRALERGPEAGWRGLYTSREMRALLEELGFELLEDFFHEHLAEGNTSVVIFRKP